MGRVLKCIATALALCLAGCSDAALKQKVKDLEQENAELKKRLEDKQPAPAGDTGLPVDEALDYLEGKHLRVPDNLDGDGKPGKELVIQRGGARQLVVEGASTSSLTDYKEKTYQYALVYVIDDASYFAEVLITVRQVGDQRVCTGVQVMPAKRVTKRTGTKPK